MARFSYNGVNYDNADFRVRFLGRDVIGDIEAFEGKEEREVEANYGLGTHEPVSTNVGNIKYSGKIKLVLAQWFGIMKANGFDGSLTDLEFDFYATVGDGIKKPKVNMVFEGCRFKSFGISAAADNQHAVHETDLYIHNIKYSE